MRSTDGKTPALGPALGAPRPAGEPAPEPHEPRRAVGTEFPCDGELEAASSWGDAPADGSGALDLPTAYDLAAAAGPDFLDPLALVLAQQRPRPVAPSSVPIAAEELIARCLVNGDGRSGRVRLELGAGGLDGSVVDLVYDGDRGELQVDVHLQPSASETTRRRVRALGESLQRRGLPLTLFEVHAS